MITNAITASSGRSYVSRMFAPTNIVIALAVTNLAFTAKFDFNAFFSALEDENVDDIAGKVMSYVITTLSTGWKLSVINTQEIKEQLNELYLRYKKTQNWRELSLIDKTKRARNMLILAACGIGLLGFWCEDMYGIKAWFPGLAGDGIGLGDLPLSFVADFLFFSLEMYKGFKLLCDSTSSFYAPFSRFGCSQFIKLNALWGVGMLVTESVLVSLYAVNKVFELYKWTFSIGEICAVGASTALLCTLSFLPGVFEPYQVSESSISRESLQEEIAKQKQKCGMKWIISFDFLLVLIRSSCINYLLMSFLQEVLVTTLALPIALGIGAAITLFSVVAAYENFFCKLALNHFRDESTAPQPCSSKIFQLLSYYVLGGAYWLLESNSDLDFIKQNIPKNTDNFTLYALFVWLVAETANARASFVVHKTQAVLPRNESWFKRGLTFFDTNRAEHKPLFSGNSSTMYAINA
jgi:hypothetical protein